MREELQAWSYILFFPLLPFPFLSLLAFFIHNSYYLNILPITHTKRIIYSLDSNQGHHRDRKVNKFMPQFSRKYLRSNWKWRLPHSTLFLRKRKHNIIQREIQNCSFLTVFISFAAMPSSRFRFLLMYFLCKVTRLKIPDIWPEISSSNLTIDLIFDPTSVGAALNLITRLICQHIWRGKIDEWEFKVMSCILHNKIRFMLLGSKGWTTGYSWLPSFLKIYIICHDKRSAENCNHSLSFFVTSLSLPFFFLKSR